MINVGIATRAKIVMARNEDEDDDLFLDHHVPRRLLLAVMVSFEEVLDVGDILDSFCQQHFSYPAGDSGLFLENSSTIFLDEFSREWSVSCPAKYYLLIIPLNLKFRKNIWMSFPGFEFSLELKKFIFR